MNTLYFHCLLTKNCFSVELLNEMFAFRISIDNVDIAKLPSKQAVPFPPKPAMMVVLIFLHFCLHYALSTFFIIVILKGKNCTSFLFQSCNLFILFFFCFESVLNKLFAYFSSELFDCCILRLLNLFTFVVNKLSLCFIHFLTLLIKFIAI